MSERLGLLVAALEAAVLDGPGDTTKSERKAAADGQPEGANVAAFVEKVRRHAVRVTDDDIADLRKSGLTEDAVFELTAAAALGAALVRLRAALRVIGEVSE